MTTEVTLLGENASYRFQQAPTSSIEFDPIYNSDRNAWVIPHNATARITVFDPKTKSINREVILEDKGYKVNIKVGGKLGKSRRPDGDLRLRLTPTYDVYEIADETRHIKADLGALIISHISS